MTTEPDMSRTAGPEDHAEARSPLVATLQTSMTALGAVDAGALNATQSAIGSATVQGDAELSASAVGVLSVKGDASLRMGTAATVMAEGDASLSQGAAAVVVAGNVSMERSLTGAILANRADVRQGNVVLLLSRETTLSEGSRVLFDWKASLILAGVALALTGMAGVLGFLLVRRGVGAARRFTDSLPHLPEFPHLPDWTRALGRVRGDS
jgi:hypothetical protein